jgi:hypothetical protein
MDDQDLRTLRETEIQLNLQLLKDVHPVYTQALTIERNDGCKPFIRARLAEIGLQLQPVSIPCDLNVIGPTLLEKFSVYLNQVLHSLDDIVVATIFDHVTQLRQSMYNAGDWERDEEVSS